MILDFNEVLSFHTEEMVVGSVLISVEPPPPPAAPEFRATPFPPPFQPPFIYVPPPILFIKPPLPTYTYSFVPAVKYMFPFVYAPNPP